MKKVHAQLILALIAGMAFASCDKVESPIDEPTIVIVDSTTIYPEIDTATMNMTSQKVYVEEFTGVKCVGCPAQTELLLALVEDNKPEIITVAYHQGQYAELTDADGDYKSDFTTEYGDVIHDQIANKFVGFPSAMVNRKTFSDEGNQLVFLAHSEWESPITKSLSNPQQGIALGVAVNYIVSKELFKIRVSINATSNLTEEHRLILLCIEDSIIAEQKGTAFSEYPHKINPAYVHRHMLRDQINSDAGPAGDVIVSGNGLIAGEWVDYTIDYSIPELIVSPEHCSVVAVVINTSSEEVIQVEEAHVVKVDE